MRTSEATGWLVLSSLFALTVVFPTKALGDAAAGYQLSLSVGPATSPSYCRSVSVNGFTFFPCDSANQDSWTTFSLQAPAGANFDSTTTGQPFNLGFRPGQTVALARIDVTPSGYGVVLGSSSSLKDPFNPNVMPRPPGSVLIVTFVFERTPGVSGEPMNWNTATGTDVLLKVKGVKWNNNITGDAYCTINDAAQYSSVTGGLGKLLVCDPTLSATNAPRFHIAASGPLATTSLTLYSHSTGQLCGFDNSGNVNCNAGYKSCCVSTGLPVSSWWTYKLKSGTNLPVSQSTSFWVQAWDANTKTPLTYWAVNKTTGAVQAVGATPSVQVPSPSYVHLVLVTVGWRTPAQQAIPSGSYVVIFSEDLQKFCRPAVSTGYLVCDGTVTTLSSSTASYTFSYGEVTCPIVGQLCS